MQTCNFLWSTSKHFSREFFRRSKIVTKVGDMCAIFKVYMTPNFFISLFERAFKMMKNGVYFIVIALLVAELFKILGYAN